MSQNSYQLLSGIAVSGIAVVKITRIAAVFQLNFCCPRMIWMRLRLSPSFKHKELLFLLLLKDGFTKQLEVFSMP